MDTQNEIPVIDVIANEDPAVVAMQQRVNEAKLALSDEMTEAQKQLEYTKVALESRIMLRQQDVKKFEDELARLKLPKEPAKAGDGPPSIG